MLYATIYNLRHEHGRYVGDAALVELNEHGGKSHGRKARQRKASRACDKMPADRHVRVEFHGNAILPDLDNGDGWCLPDGRRIDNWRYA